MEMLDASNSLLEVDAYTNPTLAPVGESPAAQSMIMPSMECVGFESHHRQQVRYTLTSFVQSVMVLSVANLES